MVVIPSQVSAFLAAIEDRAAACRPFLRTICWNYTAAIVTDFNGVTSRIVLFCCCEDGGVDKERLSFRNITSCEDAKGCGGATSL